MSNTLWGLWHNGWCYIKKNKYAGTYEEVTNTREQFIKEGNDGETYTQIPFDNTKEPIAIHSRPTESQRRVLQYILKHGSVRGYSYYIAKHPTWTLCYRHGWIMDIYLEDGTPTEKVKLTVYGETLAKEQLTTDIRPILGCCPECRAVGEPEDRRHKIWCSRR